MSAMQQDSLTDEDRQKYAEWEKNRLKSISSIIVEFFPKQMLFHSIIVAMVCVRSPTDFAVSSVIFAMFLRLLMVFAYYGNKRMIYLTAGAVENFINFILLFICMGYKPPEIESVDLSVNNSTL